MCEPQRLRRSFLLTPGVCSIAPEEAPLHGPAAGCTASRLSLALMPTGDLTDLAADLGELVRLRGPSGGEDDVAHWITRRLEQLSLLHSRDSSGNVRLVPTGSRPRVLVTAHMDQVSYMVSRVESDRAYCLPVGLPDIPDLAQVAVEVLGDSHPPIAAQLQEVGNQGGVIQSSRVNEMQAGDRVVFAGELDISTATGRARGPALDDRLGCLAILRAACVLAAETSEVAFAWTVREETEQAGVVRVTRELDPEVVIAVDVTYATSADQAPDSIVAVGGGPVITLLDGGMVADRPLVRVFDSAARHLGMQWQREVVRDGVSEAGRVHQRLGIPALALLVPIDDPHSPIETAELRDVAAVIDLLVAGIREILYESGSQSDGETTRTATRSRQVTA